MKYATEYIAASGLSAAGAFQCCCRGMLLALLLFLLLRVVGHAPLRNVNVAGIY